MGVRTAQQIYKIKETIFDEVDALSNEFLKTLYEILSHDREMVLANLQVPILMKNGKETIFEFDNVSFADMEVV
jgi:hypothetical protein